MGESLTEKIKPVLGTLFFGVATSKSGLFSCFMHKVLLYAEKAQSERPEYQSGFFGLPKWLSNRPT